MVSLVNSQPRFRCKGSFAVVLGVALTFAACPNAVAQDSRYSVSVDGQEVVDPVTRLVWRRCAEGMFFVAGACSGTAMKLTHEEALVRAKAEATNTGKSWRVPDIKELSSLVDRARIDPAIDTVVFPTTPTDLWSSTPNARSPDRAWGVSFLDGAVSHVVRIGRVHVRLVRFIQ